MDRAIPMPAIGCSSERHQPARKQAEYSGLSFNSYKNKTIVPCKIFSWNENAVKAKRDASGQSNNRQRVVGHRARIEDVELGCGLGLDS